MTCSKCLVDKDLSLFHKRKAKPRGYSYWCKVCSKEYQTAWNEINPGKHRSIINKANKNRNLITYSRHNSTTGVSIFGRSLLMIKNGGDCEICGKKPSEEHFRQFNIDHDHDSGDIRGILCHNCNVGLGNFKDNPKFLERAIEYIANNK